MIPKGLADQQVEQVARALRQRIRGRGRSLREVEEVSGMGRDYLRQLLSGNMDLKLKHVFAVLAVLEEKPAEFFAGVFGLTQLGEPEPLHPLFRESITAAQRSVLPVLITNLQEKGILSADEAKAMLAALEPEAPAAS